MVPEVFKNYIMAIFICLGNVDLFAKTRTARVTIWLKIGKFGIQSLNAVFFAVSETAIIVK